MCCGNVSLKPLHQSKYELFLVFNLMNHLNQKKTEFDYFHKPRVYHNRQLFVGYLVGSINEFLKLILFLQNF